MGCLISICIPCHNRTYDLKKTLPFTIAAIKGYEPIEIVILDYNSPDDLQSYINTVDYQFITYRKYTGRDYYHMAHARNLSVKTASGEYIIVFSTDLIATPEFLKQVREMVDTYHPDCVYSHKLEGVLVCKKEQFMLAGGFDERFEFYGPEDKDLFERMRRRNLSFVALPSKLINYILTPKEDKIRNYRLKIRLGTMHHITGPIYRENCEGGILVANKGKDWGSWD